MNNQEFINKLVHIANDCKSTYKTGGWGQHDGDVWQFDCICLIKGILWGWKEDYNDRNGGAVYGSNGVHDDTEIGILNRCSGVTDNFVNIEVGEYLYMQGHGGIYIGNGKVVECTVAWERKVQISDIANDGTRSKNGKVVGRWLKHGKLPYIEYMNVEPVRPQTNYAVRDLQHALNCDYGCNLVEDNCCGPLTRGQVANHNIQQGATGEFVKWVQTRLITKGYSCGSCGVDGSFGPATEIAVRKFQKDNRLVVDGIVGINTTLKLL